MDPYLSYFRYIRSHPVLLLLLTGLVVLLGLPALRVQVNNNMEDWFPANSPFLQDKQQFKEDFGNDELMFLVLTFPDSASEGYKDQTLTSLSDTLATCYGIESVFSRFQLNQLPTLMGMKSRVKKLEKLFFSAKEQQVEMVYLKPRLIEKFDTYRPKLLDSIRHITATLPPDIRTDLTGSGVIFSEIEKISNQESGLLLGIAFVIIFILLGIRLQDVRRWGISLLIFMLLFWPAYSLFGWLDIPVNMITMVVPILLLINFFAYVLHLVSQQVTDPEVFIQKKLPPIVFSAITTMIGFGSLMLSDILIIHQFGLLTFGGILAGLIVLLVVGVPLIFSILPATHGSALIKNPMELRGFQWFLGQLSYRWSLLLAAVMPVVLLGGILLFPCIEVDTHTLHILPADDQIRTSTRYIENAFGSFNTIDFLVDKTDDSRISPQDFAIIRHISDQLDTLDFVDGVVSHNLWRPILRMVSIGDKEIAHALEATYLTADKQRTRLSLRIPMGSVQEMKTQLAQIEQVIATTLAGTPLSIRAVGYLPIYIEQFDLIVSGMLKSLGFACLCILITMMLMVRNWKLGLMAILPNTFPLGGLAIMMAVFGIPLDLGNSVIACVIVGLVVDDTLHIIWNYQKEYKLALGGNVDLGRVMQDILRPSTTTSMIFSLGFMVLILSEMRSVHNFGLLVTCAIVLGWIGDFVLFPALLNVISRNEKRRDF